ncbi:MAG: pro-sigmaK processing inhibitor BofA family protein [Bacillota bacterium]|nr:pro-sigmaK processing inhibitor BofA family protein [Bacillota bacterium]
MEMAAYFLVAVVLLYLLAKVFSWPFRMLGKLILNSLLGLVLLIIFNFIGKSFGVTLGINAATVLIAGFLGVPGIAFLVIFKLFL